MNSQNDFQFSILLSAVIELSCSFAWFWNRRREPCLLQSFMLIASRNTGNVCWHTYIPLLRSNGRARLIHQRNCHLRKHLGKSISLHKWAICFFYNMPPTLLVRMEQLGWKWWIALNGQLPKSYNFSGSHWADDNKLFWQQNKLSSCGISVSKRPCTLVRCKIPKHFSFFDFLSYLLSRFIPLMYFKFWSYLLFFTWTLNSLIHWLVINLARIYHTSFYICIYDIRSLLLPVLLRYSFCFTCTFPKVPISIYLLNMPNLDSVIDIYKI